VRGFAGRSGVKEITEITAGPASRLPCSGAARIGANWLILTHFSTRPANMTIQEVSSIQSWHAHVYFDAQQRDAAWTLREQIEARFADKLQMGRFHERPVGPHPMWSYQLAFETQHFAEIVGWLSLNHGALDVFAHPNTSDALRDHRDCAVWIGKSHQLKLDVFGK
jgi:DOPA 4,5-dioxygenase